MGTASGQLVGKSSSLIERRFFEWDGPDYLLAESARCLSAVGYTSVAVHTRDGGLSILEPILLCRIHGEI